jgi:hypothetical protein
LLYPQLAVGNFSLLPIVAGTLVPSVSVPYSMLLPAVLLLERPAKVACFPRWS